jgi:tetratricopeptide (TPR) repeat protein
MIESSCLKYLYISIDICWFAMSPWIFLIGLIVLFGSGLASDVPFVFVEDADLASYSSILLEEISSSSTDLVGVPSITTASDNEVLEIPVTGGGSTSEGKLEMKVANLKDAMNKRVEPGYSRIREDAAIVASKYPGDLRIEQICEVYNYLKYGDSTKSGWRYLRDPRGVESWNYANDSLMIGDKANCVGVGDCDDFAIVMASFVESIGGATRIILANNDSMGGHAFTEVYVGQLSDPNCRVEEIFAWLRQEFDTDIIYGHIDTDTKEAWLNLDWGADEKGNAHPGGPLFQGDEHHVLRIRDINKLIPLRMSEAINKPPRLISLTPDKNSPQEVGSVITWTAIAKDPDNDQILCRFFLNGYPVTKWTNDNLWTWTTQDADIGDNQIEVYVIDRKHAGPNRFDSNTARDFSITESSLVPLKPEEEPLSDAEAWNNKGMVLAYQGKYDDAIQAFDQAIKVDPQYSEAWYDKGYVLAYQGKYDDAIQAYDQAIKVNPQYSEAWNNKGYALISLGRNEEGLQACNKALEIDPNNAMARANKAWALNNLGRTELQQQDTPLSDADSWFNKGYDLNNEGKYDEAIQAFDKTLKIDPNNAYAWNNKGYALISLGRNEEGLQACDKALEINPNNTYAWNNKAWALNNLGKNEESLQAYNRAIEIDPNNAMGWANKASILINLGENEEGLQASERAIEMDPNNTLGWAGKALALLNLGRREEGLQASKKAIELATLYLNSMN